MLFANVYVSEAKQLSFALFSVCYNARKITKMLSALCFKNFQKTTIASLDLFETMLSSNTIDSGHVGWRTRPLKHPQFYPLIWYNTIIFANRYTWLILYPTKSFWIVAKAKRHRPILMVGWSHFNQYVGVMLDQLIFFAIRGITLKNVLSF